MPYPTSHPLQTLVAATHTPFHADGALNLAVVETQAAHMIKNSVTTVFIGGSTGESHSLTLDERRKLAERWFEVIKGTSLKVVVHVGSNCLADCRTLAAQAQQLGAVAISSLAPSYFKPKDVSTLVACAADIASAAPETPFYFYDIPVLTGVNLSMPDFLKQAPEKIPTLSGLKFTNPDLMAYQCCLHADGGAWDIPWGLDEIMLGALAMGARGAVGSSFNFAAPVYQRLIKAFHAGDMKTAREEQFKSVRLIQLLASYGYMGAAKATMKMLGVDVGPARLPNGSLTAARATKLEGELETMGFFEWIG